MPETARAGGDKLRYVAPSGALIEEIDWFDPEAVFLPHGAREGALWLDSSAPQHELARYSFIALAPYDMLRFAAHEAAQGLAVLQEKLAAESALWRDLPPDIDAQVPPFRGGAAGLFGYDLGLGLETAFHADNAPPQAQSDALVVGIYASLLAFDHRAQRCFIIATGLPQPSPAARADAARQDILRWQKLLTGVPSAVLPPPPAAPDLASPPHSNFSKHAYCDAVSAIVAHILNGDIFQANLAQYFTAQLAEGDNALAYYRRLRRAGPAPFSAFFQMGERALASASPERFLQIANGRVETRPIKGTQKRGRNAQEDLAIAAALAASEKDRAENVMIVDCCAMIWPKIAASVQLRCRNYVRWKALPMCIIWSQPCAVLCRRMSRRSSFWPIVSPAGRLPVRRKFAPCSLSGLMKKPRAARAMAVSAISVLTGVWIPALLFARQKSPRSVSAFMSAAVLLPTASRRPNMSRPWIRRAGLWPPWALMLIYGRMRKMMKGVWLENDCRD